jgi:pimeloyl-ACP methyl ester carboxylesterase
MPSQAAAPGHKRYPDGVSIVTQQHEHLKSVWTTVQGLKVHARVSTKLDPIGRPSVVLVHGLVVSSRYLIPTGELLAPHFNVYIPDLPGFGRSEKPSDVYTVEQLAGWLIAWMDAIGLERPAFLANSMGCQVIVEAAVRHPDRVRNIVLSGPVVDRHARKPLVQILRALRVYFYEKPSLITIHAVDYAQAGLSVFVRSMKSMLEYPIEDKLRHIHDPVLVVRGEHDFIVPQYWAEEVAALLPQGRLVILEGAAHTTNYSTPRKLVRACRPFLEYADDHDVVEDAAVR